MSLHSLANRLEEKSWFSQGKVGYGTCNRNCTIGDSKSLIEPPILLFVI